MPKNRSYEEAKIRLRETVANGYLSIAAFMMTGSLLNILLALFGLTVLWTVVLPGAICSLAGVGTASRVEANLPKENAGTKKLQTYRTEKLINESLHNSVSAELTKLLQSQTIDGSLLNSLVDTRKYLETEISKPVPVRCAGVFEARIPYYFFVCYLALLVHCWLTRRYLPRRPSPLRVALLTCVVYLSWSSSNWWRNFAFDFVERKVFAFTHFDVSPIGFLVQEANVLGIALLVGFSWACWERVRLPKIAPTELQELLILEQARKVGAAIDRWQIHAILIGAAFLPFTIYYFNVSKEYGDVRYYPSAITIHVIWIITWALISVPAYSVFQRWREFQITTLARLLAEGQADAPVYKYLRSAAPVTHVRLAVVGSASIVSFLLPVMQLVL